MDPHLPHDSLGPSQPTTQTASLIGSTVFAQMAAECSYTLQWDARFPPELAPSYGGSGSWFPGPTQVLNPNGISISLAVFARLKCVTDRQTDRPRYSVGNNRPYVVARCGLIIIIYTPEGKKIIIIIKRQFIMRRNVSILSYYNGAVQHTPLELSWWSL